MFEKKSCSITLIKSEVYFSTLSISAFALKRRFLSLFFPTCVCLRCTRSRSWSEAQAAFSYFRRPPPNKFTDLIPANCWDFSTEKKWTLLTLEFLRIFNNDDDVIDANERDLFPDSSTWVSPTDLTQNYPLKKITRSTQINIFVIFIQSR